ASAGGPYSAVEVTPVTLNGTALDPDNDPRTVSWTRTIVTAPAGTTCNFTATTTLTPTLTCNDQATVDVTLTVSGGYNPAVSHTPRFPVPNAAPAVGAPTATPNPVAVNSSVALSASFTDKGTHASHTATINWGDGATTTGTVSEVAGSGTGTVTGSHTYT